MKRPHNPARAARRNAEALEQLGMEQPRCIYCGNTDPLVVRPRRIVNHHIFGDERDSTTVFACLNCHAVAHEDLRDAEVPMSFERRTYRLCSGNLSSISRPFFIAGQSVLAIRQKNGGMIR